MIKVKGWTAGRLQGFIIGTLRQGMRRYPPKYEALLRAKIGKRVNKKTGRKADHYRCAECKKAFPKKDVQVDHRKPVVDPKKGFVDWNTYIERLFCGIRNLQVLCTGCHKIKTQKEKTKRTKK